METFGVAQDIVTSSSTTSMRKHPGGAERWGHGHAHGSARSSQRSEASTLTDQACEGARQTGIMTPVAEIHLQQSRCFPGASNDKGLSGCGNI